MVWQYRKCDGTRFDFEISLSRLAFSGEVFLLGITRDFQERKIAEWAVDAGLHFETITAALWLQEKCYGS